MLPIIFTCRSIKEGGEPITIDDDQVVDLHTAVSPSVLAVLRLMANSNLEAWMTGKSAGFSPLRMRPEWSPGLKVASSDRFVSEEKLDHNVLELRIIHSRAGSPRSQPGWAPRLEILCRGN
jgi:hypothetical protein